MNRSEFYQALLNEKFQSFCDKWQRLLILENWEITYELTNIVNGDVDIKARCQVHRELGHLATITFAERCSYDSDREREELVIHELTHIVLDELGQFVLEYMPVEHHNYFVRLVDVATSDLSRSLAGVVEIE